MDPENFRYWLNLALGAPTALLWFVIVLCLTIYAAKGEESPRQLRRVAISTAIACGIFTTSYLLLIAWNPDWYADWIGHAFMLSILNCYFVSLTCMIWRRNPPQTPEKARLTLYQSACTALFVNGILISEVVATEPSNALLLIPFGIIAACVIVVLLNAKRQLSDSRSPNGD